MNINPLEMLESAYWYLLSQVTAPTIEAIQAANIIHEAMRQIRQETTDRLIKKYN